MCSSIAMSTEAESRPIVSEGTETQSTSSKVPSTLSSQLVLSPTSPAVNGMRQSTISFKAQRARVSTKTVGTNGVNTTSVMISKFTMPSSQKLLQSSCLMLFKLLLLLGTEIDWFARGCWRFVRNAEVGNEQSFFTITEANCLDREDSGRCTSAATRQKTTKVYQNCKVNWVYLIALWLFRLLAVFQLR